MNIIITNRTVNTTNTKINKFSIKISRGDNKNLLYTLPYVSFTESGWIVICYEDLENLSGTICEKIQTFINKFEPINKILFFRANGLIRANWEEIKIMSVYKLIYIDDLHTSKEISELRALDRRFFNYFDKIISTYAYCFKKFFNYADINKIYWFPHSFNEQLKIEYNHNPKNKILLSGCVCDAYPMRKKLMEISETKMYPIDILEHPRYSKDKLHDIIGKKFIEKINEYRFGFTCCLNKSTPYIVQKFFEIPGSGALLIAYDVHVKIQLKELGFIDMVNYIGVNDTNLEDKIQWVLDPLNSIIIEQIRLEGYNFINSNHTHEIRTKKLLEHLE